MNKKYKTVNISSSAMYRTRCRYCGKSQRICVNMLGRDKRNSPSEQSKINLNRHKINFPDPNIIIDSTIKAITSFSLSNKNHKKRRSSSISEFAFCDCFMSKFEIQEDNAKTKLEVLNRRGKYTYPFKLEP